MLAFIGFDYHFNGNVFLSLYRLENVVFFVLSTRSHRIIRENYFLNASCTVYTIHNIVYEKINKKKPEK